MHPHVSVIIPAYNRGACLARALDSVLTQTLQPQEVIVVDDKSTDSSVADTLTRYSDRFEQQGITFLSLVNPENAGAARSRNRGVAASGGGMLAFLDSDDAWHPSHLETCLGILQSESGTDFLASNHYDQGKQSHRNPMLPSTGAKKTLVDDAYEFKFSATKAPLRTSGLVMTKAGFESIGGFDEDLGKHQDWDLVMRFNRANGRFVYNLGSTVLIHSESENRMSHSSNYTASLRFLKRHHRGMKISHRVRFSRAVIKSLKKDKKYREALKFTAFFLAIVALPRSK
ncbi:MAG: glycosyltransferase family 2 protein [Halomonadaceae bacterium]|nr:MAG: glycosyltransferase family 2 protein [Halomonadaceae bacterium]